MKRLLILCIMFVVLVMPVNAGYWLQGLNQGINVNGANWSADSTGGWADTAWQVGDGDTGTLWYNYNQPNAHITYNNPLGYYYTKVRIFGTGGAGILWECNGVSFTSIDGWTNLSLSGAGPVSCTNETHLYAQIREMELELGNTPPAPTADFVGVPLNGTAPLTVLFTDTSTGAYGTTSYNWSITPVVSGNIGNSGTYRNQTTYFTVPGLYTVSHGIETPYGSDIETKTNYVNVTNASSLITAYVSALDQANGYRVLGANISIYDVENTSWSNSTSDPDGIHSISTVFGHHLNAYANAFGYTDGENLGISNIFNGVDYPVYMTNPNTSHATAGNVTLNIRVEDGNTLQPIAGAAVSGVPNVGPGFNIVTDSQGIVNIVVPNKTTYGISATKTNYIMGTKNVYTGTAPGPGAVVPVFILLYPSSVTQPPSITQTTLPGGGTPQPTQTYLRHCDPALSDYNEDACRTSENTGMMDQLREAGPGIIGLCIVAILMGLLKIIMG
jgi:PKD repeat protein